MPIAPIAMAHRRRPGTREGVVCLLVLLGLVPAPGRADEAGVQIEVRSEGAPLPGASVQLAGQEATTDATGTARLSAPPGTHEVAVQAGGFLPESVSATVVEGRVTRVTVELEPLEEEVTVTATRSTTRLSDQPLRVETIDREEIEEKALMTPGSIAMLLAETTGLRVQTTAPSLGATNVRIQGLRGHYSQLLADGLPLYGVQGDSLSLLQVPPLDLGRVEIIKGVASALYGASALGGVVNLVSRRPQGSERELLLNVTSLEGVDATGWLAGGERRAWSLLSGYHRQEVQDVDGDGWSDVAAYERGLLRPRLFVEDGSGGSLALTIGLSAEDRSGGTLEGAQAPDGGPFEEAIETRHADAGLVARKLVGERLLALRGSFSRTEQDHGFGTAREWGARLAWFAEASLSGTSGRHTWVLGTAFQQDRYEARDLPSFDYVFSTPAAFVQDEISFGPRLLLAASARADFHSEYGTLVSPRLSLLARSGGAWTLRASAGTGAFAPTPFNEETDETGLSRLQPLAGLRAERAAGASLDLTFRRGPLEISGTAFGSRVRHAARLRPVGPATVALFNASSPTRTWGSELLARYRRERFTALLTHAWTRSTEEDDHDNERVEVPLTPRHTGSLNLIWEEEGLWGFGIEMYYIGRQRLEDDPYRLTGRPHVLIGVLGQRRFGRVRLFLNSENLLDVRQTRHAPLLRPSRRPDGRWTVDAWAPIDGRVFNGGVRIEF